MTYPGGKSGAGVYQTLINLMPPHEIYIEPFLGAGAVMRMKRPAKMNIGIDIDPKVIRAWQSAATLKIARADPLSTRAENGERIRRRRSPKKPIPQAESPLPALEYSNRGNGEARSRQHIELASLVLPSGPEEYAFWIGDATAWMRSKVTYSPHGTLIYCDPPYLHATRGRADLYAYEMTDAQHLELLSLLRELPCQVMISGYSSPMYAKALKGWNATSFQAGTRGKPAAEWVWYNFDRPTKLHDYSYLGDNFRERERLKRIKTR